MKDIVVIKFYKHEYQADFNDIFVSETNKLLNELKAFSDKINKEIYFTVIEHMQIADFNNFAEIEYTNVISEKEKEYYSNFLSKFSRDWNLLSLEKAEEIKEPFTIIFKNNNNMSTFKK